MDMCLCGVRTILVLGYWVLGNNHMYWVVTVLGDTFCRSDMQCNTDQTAVSTVHMPVKDYLVLIVTCTLIFAIVCLNTTLICYCLLGYFVVIATLYTGIGIGIGYWYR